MHRPNIVLLLTLQCIPKLLLLGPIVITVIVAESFYLKTHTVNDCVMFFCSQGEEEDDEEKGGQSFK